MYTVCTYVFLYAIPFLKLNPPKTKMTIKHHKTSTIWRCISCWRWGLFNVMLVFSDVTYFFHPKPIKFSVKEIHLGLVDGQCTTSKSSHAYFATNIVQQLDVIFDLLPGKATMHCRSLVLINLDIIYDILCLIIVETANRAHCSLSKPWCRILNQIPRLLAKSKESWEGEFGLIGIQRTQMITKTMR